MVVVVMVVVVVVVVVVVEEGRAFCEYLACVRTHRREREGFYGDMG